ncbi:trans-sulfuration enzyme family protein [Limnoglobus roseus]|uniref:PLP-dependent transferase n=1 Tax=Limnoglobus roseus TaxID=2598579 RepID=A0A5C1AEJ5_9BACT|nr:PLP-dependent aspartate aminotransferase family protein [Limnoglobus roseus]QEL16613.1 PLP-dependent transferase [Limnoglobus roseus]
MLPDFGPTVPLTPPIYPSAVYHIPDLDAVDAIYNGEATGYVYARDGHPNASMLGDELRQAHAAEWGVVAATGMAALSAPFLALLSQGGRVIASNRIYGKTTVLLRDEFPRFGVSTTWVDTNDLDAVEAALAAGPAQILFTETISNPLCRVADVPALAEIAYRHGARLFLDNTFATPTLCKPLEMGANLVMESLTKMIGGHSDVILGFVCGREPKLEPTVATAVSTWGLAANPFECWLTSRGLATLDLRMRAATANAVVLAEWLGEQPGVSRVIYPGRADHPDFELAKRVLPHGVGNMLCFELADRNAVNRWMRATPAVPFCPSLGHHTTTCSHPDTTSHRFDPVEEKRRQGITPGLVRLSVGCEPIEQLQAAIGHGLTGG